MRGRPFVSGRVRAVAWRPWVSVARAALVCACGHAQQAGVVRVGARRRPSAVLVGLACRAVGAFAVAAVAVIAVAILVVLAALSARAARAASPAAVVIVAAVAVVVAFCVCGKVALPSARTNSRSACLHYYSLSMHELHAYFQTKVTLSCF